MFKSHHIASKSYLSQFLKHLWIASFINYRILKTKWWLHHVCQNFDEWGFDVYLYSNSGKRNKFDLFCQLLIILYTYCFHMKDSFDNTQLIFIPWDGIY